MRPFSIRYNGAMSTKLKGDIGESAALAKLTRAGFVVSIPFGDRARYDLVIEKDGNLERVQVKTARVEGGSIVFPARSKAAGMPARDYKGQVEYMAGYCPELDKLYLVPIDECGTRSITLRLSPSKNNQTKGVRWAEHYEV